ncbi:MAG TPA: zinc ribbon domain-containing protein [Rhodanobacteraceae bacterium]|nr:zinc ribbon domain-containing protein [Rhodanobacteraceae bacterium]
MPIYEYAPSGPAHCPHCEQGFERLQRLADAPLTTCPECGAAVERRISAPNMAMGGAHLLKESNVEKKGFTQYRRIGKGTYEKTAGRGPRHISGD